MALKGHEHPADGDGQADQGEETEGPRLLQRRVLLRDVVLARRTALGVLVDRLAAVRTGIRHVDLAFGSRALLEHSRWHGKGKGRRGKRYGGTKTIARGLRRPHTE